VLRLPWTPAFAGVTGNGLSRRRRPFIEEGNRSHPMTGLAISSKIRSVQRTGCS